MFQNDLNELLNQFLPKEYEQETFMCPVHGAFTGRATRLPWEENGVKHPPECPKCAFEREEKERAEQRRKAELKRLQEMNIGKCYWEKTFDTFNAYTPALAAHLAAARNFAEKPNGRKLLLVGEHGNGKTHLAVSILKITGGAMYTAYEIGMMIRQCYGGKGSKTKEADLLRELCRKECLVIDELDKVEWTKFNQHWLSYIVNKRHENMRPMVFISNHHMESDCKSRGCPMCFEKAFGSDIISRFAENAHILVFKDADYRYKIRSV